MTRIMGWSGGGKGSSIDVVVCRKREKNTEIVCKIV
jgi:hypothetical protein